MLCDTMPLPWVYPREFAFFFLVGSLFPIPGAPHGPQIIN